MTQEFDRLSVNISNETSADIEKLLYMTGENVTDITNSAIIVYASFVREQRAGGAIITVNADGTAYHTKILRAGQKKEDLKIPRIKHNNWFDKLWRWITY